jgi:hypothetical protein
MAGVEGFFSSENLRNIPVLFAGLWLAILFLQSGVDKIVNYKGNLEWLTGHFEKSPLKGTVGLMLPVLTLMECSTGALAVGGIVFYVLGGTLAYLFCAGVLGATTLTALFFGQRMAQDYPGAVSLVPYFILALGVIYLTISR